MSVYGKTIQQLTTRYSMVYMENDACPEKKDFLRRIEDSQGYTTVPQQAR